MERVKPLDSYLVFDFETTGLEPTIDRIIQIGLCEVREGQIIRRAGWLVNQNIAIPAGATAVHGITTADIRSKGESPVRSLHLFLNALTAARQCMGHNIHRFDLAFLRAECVRLGHAMPEVENHIDTAALYKGWRLAEPKRATETHMHYANRILSLRVRGLKYSLATCIVALGIDLDSEKLHDASVDAYAAHLVYAALRPRL